MLFLFSWFVVCFYGIRSVEQASQNVGLWLLFNDNYDFQCFRNPADDARDEFVVIKNGFLCQQECVFFVRIIFRRAQVFACFCHMDGD